MSHHSGLTGVHVARPSLGRQVELAVAARVGLLDVLCACQMPDLTMVWYGMHPLARIPLQATRMNSDAALVFSLTTFRHRNSCDRVKSREQHDGRGDLEG